MSVIGNFASGLIKDNLIGGSSPDINATGPFGTFSKLMELTQKILNGSAIPSDTPDSVTESGEGSSSSMDDYGYDFIEYLEGLFSSVGAEHEINRQYNSAEAALNRAFQAEEAAKQREWYTELSNSAYSRAMADMKRAGLNPILAYQNGGASSSAVSVPGGSSASYNSSNGDTLSSLLSSAADIIAAFLGNANSSSKLNKILDFIKRK